MISSNVSANYLGNNRVEVIVKEKVQNTNNNTDEYEMVASETGLFGNEKAAKAYVDLVNNTNVFYVPADNSLLMRDIRNSSPVTDPKELITTKNIKPTGGPIIHFNDKNGEKFMAREVIINGDTKAFAVSNIKSPSQAVLMNEEVFEKYMLEILPEIKK